MPITPINLLKSEPYWPGWEIGPGRCRIMPGITKAIGRPTSSMVFSCPRAASWRCWTRGLSNSLKPLHRPHPAARRTRINWVRLKSARPLQPLQTREPLPRTLQTAIIPEQGPTILAGGQRRPRNQATPEIQAATNCHLGRCPRPRHQALSSCIPLGRSRSSKTPPRAHFHLKD